MASRKVPQLDELNNVCTHINSKTTRVGDHQALPHFPALMAAQALAQTQPQDDEVQMGQEFFNELKVKGEIIESSPLCDRLNLIADAITKAAQPQYNHPFKFYLVHETQPNALRDSRRQRIRRGFIAFPERQHEPGTLALI